jgi:hypothetical protein
MHIRSFPLALGTPSRVVDLLYEAGIEQLLDFFTNEVLPLNRLLLGLLLDRSGIRVDLQMVLNHVDVSPDKGDEHEFPFAVQVTRDTSSLSSFGNDLYGLHRDVLLGRGLHTAC